MAEGKTAGQRPYKVLRIDERVRVGAAGGVEKYYTHTIETRLGTVLSVDIEARDFTADKAGPILEKHAVEADKIKVL